MNENQSSGPRRAIPPGEPTWQELADAEDDWDEFDKLCETVGRQRAEEMYGAPHVDNRGWED